MHEYLILVAEDDDDDYFILKDIFDQDGACKLRRVKDGRLLMDYLSVGPIGGLPLPDLILLDLNMPRMDGLTALRIIKSITFFASIPVIVYTTSGDPLQKKACLASGALRCEKKGSSERDISRFVSDVVSFLRETPPMKHTGTSDFWPGHH